MKNENKKANNELLAEKQEDINQLVSGHIKTHPIDASSISYLSQKAEDNEKKYYKEPLKNILGNSGKKYIKDEYKEIIKNLNKLKDFNNNIYSIFDEGKKIFLRDARIASPNKDSKNEITYKIQLLNIARAAELIAETDKKDFFVPIRNLVGNILKEMDAGKDENDLKKILLKFNAEIIGLTAEKCGITTKEAHAKLNLAKEYIGFDDDHYSIVTIYDYNGEGKIFTETDIILAELTDAQLEEFVDRTNKEWFKNLDPFNQKLIDKQIEKITDGQHVCPTQLRELPLIRNAYRKNIHQINKDGPELLGTSTHSGTHYVDTKQIPKQNREAEEKRLIKLVTDQQQSFTPAESAMVVVDLLSPIPGSADRKMNKALSEVDRGNNGLHLNLPQNIGRIIVSQNMEPINKIFASIRSNIVEHPKIIDDYLDGKNDDVKQVRNCINREKFGASDESKIRIARNIFNLMVDVKELSNRNFLSVGLDPENIRLQIANKLEQLSDELNKTEIIKFEFVMQCKSGKDRTGVKQLYNLAGVIGKALNKDSKEIIDGIGGYSNSILIPGLSQGGTTGCYGIKKAANSVFPKSISGETKSKLILFSAENNNLPYDKKLASKIEKENNIKRKNLEKKSVDNDKLKDTQTIEQTQNKEQKKKSSKLGATLIVAGIIIAGLAFIGLVTGGLAIPLIGGLLVAGALVGGTGIASLPKKREISEGVDYMRQNKPETVRGKNPLGRIKNPSFTPRKASEPDDKTQSR